MPPSSRSNGSADGSPSTIQVLDRSIAILRQIAESDHPLNANELAQLCKLNRTTAWRILGTLEQHGLVERDPFTQRYTISLELGRLAAAGDSGRLLRSARSVLQGLADESGEQVSLGVPNPFGFTYIDHVQPRATNPVPRWLGPSGPLHASASGKLFLCFLPPEERASLLAGPLERYTPRTVVDPTKLAAQIEQIKSDGFATCLGEHDELTSAVCSPITDAAGRLVAIIDLWGPSQRLTQRQLKVLAPAVRRASEDISTRLSATAPAR